MLYVSDASDSDMEAQKIMLCCIVAGVDRKIATSIHQVLIQVNPFVEMFPRAGELIRNQKFSTFDWQFWKARESIGEHTIVKFVTRWPPFNLTIIWEPNETLLCTNEAGYYSELAIGRGRRIHCNSFATLAW